MTAIKKWGSLGTKDGKFAIAFEHMSSPVYGSVTSNRKARYTTHRRIITRNEDGSLSGQKPLRQVAGLDLKECRLSFKLSSIILTTLSNTFWGRLALEAGAGPIFGSKIGEENENRSVYSDIDKFKTDMETALTEQLPLLYYIGEKFEGFFEMDSLEFSELHRPDGGIKTMECDVQLTEWVEP